MFKYSFLFLCIAVAWSCRETVVESIAVVPEIREATVHPGDGNVLSAVVSLRMRFGARAAVEVLRDSVTEQLTPSFPVIGETLSVPVLGLRPATPYLFRAKVSSRTGDTALSPPLMFTTRPLPAGLPAFVVEHEDSPTVSHVLVGVAPAVGGQAFAIIIDAKGNPVWYKAFADGVTDFQKQPDGNYTAWGSTDSTPSSFHEFTSLGEEVAVYRASNMLKTDPHELRMIGRDYALLGIEFRTMDLSAYGGSPSAEVEGFVVEYRRAGQAPFLWNTFDHFMVTDGAPDVSYSAPTVDPWHGNAIDIDHDGNLLVSFRDMDEITKIDVRTGGILWRLGGKNNEFTFLNDELHGFSHQHGVRRLPNGDIILFDNGNLHDPPTSRAVEYRLDLANKTAELVWEYRPDPPLYGFALGFAQRLASGNTLVCFGTARRIIEIDPGGRKRWEIRLDDPLRYPYRAIDIGSLY
jgi:hypothetical protein